MYPPDLIEALKDALRSIYWYKRQLRSFLENSRVPPEIVAQQQWNDPQEYKAIIVDKVVNALVARGDESIGSIRELIRHVVEMSDFSHLLKENEGRRLKKEAEVYVERLRQLVHQHNTKIRRQKEEREGRKKAAEQRLQAAAGFALVEQLKARFYEIVAISSPQERGRRLEPFLFDLFNAFDLQPRGAFSLRGEQIDGAFEMGGNRFLMEAKWEKTPIGAREIRSFKEQVEGKLETTLGLFISVNGFTDEGVDAVQRSRPNLILLDGEDLSAVLEGMIDLRELLKRKLRHAAETGSIYRRYRDMALDASGGS
jgi:hypothetical protein